MVKRLIGMRTWLALAALLAQVGVVAAAEPASTIYEDVRISGKQINSFTEAQETVSIVLGDFELTAGKQSVAGRDGVVWVVSEPGAMAVRHRITIYVEGDARVTGESGATTNEQAVLVHLLTQGRLSAAGNLSTTPLRDFPLYLRAVAAREQAANQTASATAERSVAAQRPAPELVRVGEGAPAVPAAPVEPPGPRAVEPVQFSAEQVTSQVVAGRRITIARGNVYLSQRNLRDGKFLEMRAQSAVIYTGKADQPKETRSPVSPRLPRMDQETITGVYLEDDVRIARGTGTLQAEQAYYDFLTDRAFVPTPVFRTIQEQRNIPVYIRADEVRALSAREMVFTNAKVTSSDFINPSWNIGATTAFVKDTTPYDRKREKVPLP